MARFRRMVDAAAVAPSSFLVNASRAARTCMRSANADVGRDFRSNHASTAATSSGGSWSRRLTLNAQL
ncbi:hypothetical protein QFZ56_004590 [Streptomyces achromogenes]|uniref:Uncharacterized protein n=1 Tax=Streptomyces achromogenes TaxID=67255 RepID=A0ABU0Q4Q1_STRAH|nr:hypothetical protein [Streptomyces achromogenes]